MSKRVASSCLAVALLAAGPASAQETTLSTAPLPYGEPEGTALPDGTMLPEPYAPPPIPPEAEAQPVAGPGGTYCYAGSHPVDTRVAAGPAWDESPGPHSHFYPPFDLRLFSLRADGCYVFTGDPSDFGYRGQVYAYYGAHPIHAGFGNGWCFMVGGHAHSYQPWSTSFVVVGAWHHWQGPYDRVFWSYWPYYSYYYRNHYPRHYGGGRWVRGREHGPAPRIDHVPRTHWGRGRWHGHAHAAPPPGHDTSPPRSRGGWSGHGGPSGHGGLPVTTPPPPATTMPPTTMPPRMGGVRGGWSGGVGGSTPGGWSGGRGNNGWSGGVPNNGWSGGPAPSPSPRVNLPATPLPSAEGAYKSGGNKLGAARGGWR